MTLSKRTEQLRRMKAVIKPGFERGAVEFAQGLADPRTADMILHPGCAFNSPTHQHDYSICRRCLNFGWVSALCKVERKMNLVGRSG